MVYSLPDFSSNSVSIILLFFKGTFVPMLTSFGLFLRVTFEIHFICNVEHLQII